MIQYSFRKAGYCTHHGYQHLGGLASAMMPVIATNWADMIAEFTPDTDVGKRDDCQRQYILQQQRGDSGERKHSRHRHECSLRVSLCHC